MEPNKSFTQYTQRKSTNTLIAQRTDLAMFSLYLKISGAPFSPTPDKFQSTAKAWDSVTWKIVQGFVDWQIREGHAINSVNRRLSTIKNYAKLAAKSGTLDAGEYALITTVTGYDQQETTDTNQQRTRTRIGNKKSNSIKITPEQATQLKCQTNTPQGRRDTLLMCLLLDQGLRVGEVAALLVENFDLQAGVFTFARPNMEDQQTHRLTDDTLRASSDWMQSGDCLQVGPLLRGSRKNGQLTHAGITDRAIQARVRFLGEQIGIFSLSPHDCRHYWATYWSDKVDILRLQEAGGWSSLEMPRRYVKRATIANEGMV